jgi:hypothetical protein
VSSKAGCGIYTCTDTSTQLLLLNMKEDSTINISAHQSCRLHILMKNYNDEHENKMALSPDSAAQMHGRDSHDALS